VTAGRVLVPGFDFARTKDPNQVLWLRIRELVHFRVPMVTKAGMRPHSKGGRVRQVFNELDLVTTFNQIWHERRLNTGLLRRFDRCARNGASFDWLRSAAGEAYMAVVAMR
jgi:hypothetical protein